MFSRSLNDQVLFSIQQAAERTGPPSRSGARSLLRCGFRRVDTAQIDGHSFSVYALDALETIPGRSEHRSHRG